MMDYFGTNATHTETAPISVDLTASEIVTSIMPALIGMGVVGIIAVLMLL